MYFDDYFAVCDGFPFISYAGAVNIPWEIDGNAARETVDKAFVLNSLQEIEVVAFVSLRYRISTWIRGDACKIFTLRPVLYILSLIHI